MKKPQIAIVAAAFNPGIVDPMVSAAQEEAGLAGAGIAQTLKVSGSYELPLVIDALLEKDSIDAVVALGYIELGETLHGEVMGHVVHRSLVDLQLKHKKPVGLGIIGPGATLEQAEVRRSASGRGAVRAVMQSIDVLRNN